MERTCLKVSGRISRRITTVSPMTDAPQLSPTSLCQKRRTASLMSMSGCRTLARTSMVRSARGVVWLEEPLTLDRVVPAVAPGIASQQSPSGENRAAGHAVGANRFDYTLVPALLQQGLELGVLRAGQAFQGAKVHRSRGSLRCP